jgi:NAD(P)-dependent dehydrogenase (short-subunit alcohol dehydrogenase family)
MMKSVVVTGVSTGIGWGITKVLIQKGFRVFGSVRKTADAERLSREFGGNFVPLIFDVTDEPAVQTAAQQVREQLKGETLFGLVNNAGIAVPGPLIYLSTDEFRNQLEVNLVSVLIVTKAFVPLLGTDRSLHGKPGRIINVSSAGGKNGGPFLGAYSASKHGLEGFSESLRRELILYGIDVIIIGPGSVATPIWDKAEQMDISPYEKTEFFEAAMRVQKYMINDGRNGYPPEKVGEVTLEALTYK